MDGDFAQKSMCQTTRRLEIEGFHVASRMNRKQLLLMVLAGGLLQAAAYYFAGVMASPGNFVSVPQPDTLLYCQSARMVAEGKPFVFTPGDLPSTGCTSHLYPFLLAVPYLLGAKGDALLTAGFALNAAFYLVFLLAWTAVFWKLDGRKDKAVAKLAAALGVLCGQSAICAFSQSDTGLFMAVSAALAAALFHGHLAAFGVLLALAPWARPEGMLLGGLFAAALVVRRFTGDRPTKGEWICAVFWAVSCAGVFALNFALTGIFAFQSVAYKGYFKECPLPTALSMTAQDFVKMVKTLFLGIPEKAPRDLFYLPVLGAVFAWTGIFRRDWRKPWPLPWLSVSAVASVAVVASSRWQDTNFDRYLAWMFPLWFFLMAEGAVWFSERVSAARGRCNPFPGGILLAAQAFSAAFFVAIFYGTSLENGYEYEFAKEANVKLPAEAKIGTFKRCGLSYALQGRRMVNIGGIYSPDFFRSDYWMNLELLKHRPDLRFDVWCFPGGQSPDYYGVPLRSLCGKTLLTASDGGTFREVDWKALDEARLPFQVENAETQRGRGTEKALVDAIDVGYSEDETRAGYVAESRHYRLRYPPFTMEGTHDGKRVLDGGRAVVGWDAMTFHATPGRDTEVVMRTAARVRTEVRASGIREQTVTFDSPLKLRVKVDDVEAGVFSCPIETASNTFSEVSFTLPGALIRRTDPRLEIYGDRAVFGYWFYQEPGEGSR